MTSFDQRRARPRPTHVMLALAIGAPYLAAAGAPDGEREAALEVARWLRSHAIETEHGVAFAAAPEGTNHPNRSLYAGSPGVLLFFLELHRATGDDDAAAFARRIADDLLAHVDEVARDAGTGLYTGVAGVGLALEHAFQRTGDARYAHGVERVLEHLEQRALTNPVHDVISGTTGTGLFLLWLRRPVLRERAVALARALGDRLLEHKQERRGGWSWPVGEGPGHTYPNFSHGTAGVATFLAALYDVARDEHHLEGALAGARYLLAIADTEGGGLRVPRFDPDEYAPGEAPLYYLSWCHGPAGTARLFHLLGVVTADERWFGWRDRAGRTLLRCGLPARQEGFWNNVGTCCGNVGIAEFALAMQRATGDAAYAELARVLTDDLLARSRATAAGRSWVHAEHRVRPELLAAQTGFLQGASGIGTFLLRLDAQSRGALLPPLLPDDPWHRR